ncbi:MAG: hypothetical protein HOC71_07395 [Candidatus Latescibacteria bacterium]|nr:hypothetical protein [Candidatus Latescibacterota bacterium]
MDSKNVDLKRRGMLVKGASLIGATVGGSMLSSLASCQSNTGRAGRSGTGNTSKYLKYKDKLDKCFSAV